MKIPPTLARVVKSLNARTVGVDIERLRGTITRFPNARNEICLTFDDGPSGFATDVMLDVLGRHGVRATFFCTGSNAQRHPEVFARLVGLGHEVGSHSMTHPNFNVAGVSQIYREMRESRRVLERLGGGRVRAFRAPHGRFGWEVRPIGALVGTPHMVGWDVSPAHDWVEPRRMTDFILERVTSGSVINLHDGLADRPDAASSPVSRATAACLELVVPALLAKGYRFTTISEQLAAKG